jgi:hypothetical protein
VKRGKPNEIFTDASGSVNGSCFVDSRLGVPAVVHYVDHEKVAATFIKGGNLVTDPGLIVAAARRGPGQVEYHDHTNHG